MDLGAGSKVFDDEYAMRKGLGLRHGETLDFEVIVEPEKIDPKRVGRVKTRDGGERLVYVGGNTGALRGRRTRLETPVKEEETGKVARRRLERGGKASPDTIAAGLIAAVLRMYGDRSNAVEILLAEIGFTAPASTYTVDAKAILKLGLPKVALRRVAGACAELLAESEYGFREEVDKATSKAVTKATKAARDAWEIEHGFRSESKGGK